jgi:hypothetical protein
VKKFLTMGGAMHQAANVVKNRVFGEDGSSKQNADALIKNLEDHTALKERRKSLRERRHVVINTIYAGTHLQTGPDDWIHREFIKLGKTVDAIWDPLCDIGMRLKDLPVDAQAERNDIRRCLDKVENDIVEAEKDLAALLHERTLRPRKSQFDFILEDLDAIDKPLDELKERVGNLEQVQADIKHAMANEIAIGIAKTCQNGLKELSNIQVNPRPAKLHLEEPDESD